MTVWNPTRPYSKYSLFVPKILYGPSNYVYAVSSCGLVGKLIVDYSVATR